MDACGRGGVKPNVDVYTQKVKLESTDVILSSYQSCKEVDTFYYQNFVFGQKKVELFLRYKLVI